MRFRIQEIPFVVSTEDTVVIDELVAKTMNDILQDNPLWRSVNIQSPSVGKFVALGYIETNEEASRSLIISTQISLISTGLQTG